MRELKIGDFWVILLRLAAKNEFACFHGLMLHENLFNK